MGDSPTVERQWTEDFVAGAVRLRCSYRRRGKEVLRFLVQVELFHDLDWQPIVRYDNAHGFSHRDTIHADGTQDKTAVYVGEVGATFTYAIEDLKTNCQAYRDRYLKELQP